MLLPRTIIVRILSVAMVALGVSVVSAQDYPNKPIRIVTSAPAGGSDFMARLIAAGLTRNLSQQVIVENRSSGVIQGEIVSRAMPDGYTLLVAAGALWVGPLLRKTPFDPVRDFAPITLVANSPNVLVVNTSLPVKSVKELIALAKAKPGELNYASPSTGSSPHLAAELFKSMAGVDIVRIPYKGNAQALTDLIGGQVQVTFAVSGAVGAHIKSGRVRALAITNAERSPLFPGLPTIAESGLPGYESAGMTGMFAPARTPVAVITLLNQEIVRVLKQPEVTQKFFDTGVETVGSSPEQFAAKIRAEMTRIGKVIKDAGIREE